MLISGLITAFNLLLSLVIGARLLWRAPRGQAGPEVWLGVFFIFSAFLAAALSITVYMGSADPAMALPASRQAAALVVWAVLASIGAMGLYLFTWKTFRPRSRGARNAVVIAAAVMGCGLVAQGVTEGFRVVLLPGAAYWVQWTARTVPLAWIAVESFAYFRRLRRRMSVGLADPVVTNRFLLWGTWAAAMTLSGCSDLGARLLYVWTTGQTVLIVVDEVRPIIIGTIALSSVIGAVSAGALFLTFFPTEGYRRWIEARAVTQGA